MRILYMCFMCILCMISGFQQDTKPQYVADPKIETLLKMTNYTLMNVNQHMRKLKEESQIIDIELETKREQFKTKKKAHTLLFCDP